MALPRRHFRTGPPAGSAARSCDHLHTTVLAALRCRWRRGWKVIAFGPFIGGHSNDTPLTAAERARVKAWTAKQRTPRAAASNFTPGG